MVILPQHPHLPLGKKLGLDMSEMLIHARAFYAERFKRSSEEELETALQDAIVAQGGTLVEPTRHDGPSNPSHWGPMGFELSLLGCTALGSTKLELAKNWAKAAARMAEADHDLGCAERV